MTGAPASQAGLAGPDGDRKPSASALSGSIPSASPQAYIVLTDRILRDEVCALRGELVYRCTKHDYGCARDDWTGTGKPHISVTKDATGDYPFFTIPAPDVEPISVTAAQAIEAKGFETQRLLMEVSRKFEGETRYETALRYIRERDSDAAATAAPCGDMAVPKDRQARAESIAQNTSGDQQ